MLWSIGGKRLMPQKHEITKYHQNPCQVIAITFFGDGYYIELILFGLLFIKDQVVQFRQISMFFLSLRILFLNASYSSEVQISLKLFCVTEPSRLAASLSKQQGTTIPSQVITDEDHILKQLFFRLFFMT